MVAMIITLFVMAAPIAYALSLWYVWYERKKAGL